MSEEAYQEITIVLGEIVKEGLPEGVIQDISRRLENKISIGNVREALKDVGQDIIELAL